MNLSEIIELKMVKGGICTVNRVIINQPINQPTIQPTLRIEEGEGVNGDGDRELFTAAAGDPCLL